MFFCKYNSRNKKSENSSRIFAIKNIGYQIADVNKNLIHHTKDIKVLSLTQEISLIAISASICIYVLYTNNFNIVSLIFRGGNLDSRVEQSQIIFLINESIVS